MPDHCQGRCAIRSRGYFVSFIFQNLLEYLTLFLTVVDDQDRAGVAYMNPRRRLDLINEASSCGKSFQ